MQGREDVTTTEETAAAAGTQLTVVVPTFNESGNVAEMVRRLDVVLGPDAADLSWEIIFVDDASPDGTADIVRRLARSDRRVRLIARHNRRGLSSAVVEGALAASADVVAVMDGDLQHDEAVLPKLYAEIAEDRADIASASRFLQEDGAAGLSSETRLKISNTGIRMANAAFGLEMTDPLTGFFAMRRSVVVGALPELSELGFKVLMDLITAAHPRPRITEVPFRFRERLHGESKLDNRVMYDFFLFFIEKKVSRFVPLPARFISFSLINTVGIAVHLAVLWPLVALFGAGFAVAQTLATVVAMIFNYVVNNLVTYNDRQLKGRAFYKGFLLFAVLCSVGIVGNVGVATAMHGETGEAGYMVPAVAGALITVVWNYVATQAFVWGRMLPRAFRRRRRRASQAAARSAAQTV